MSAVSGSQAHVGYVSPRRPGKTPGAPGAGGTGRYSDFVCHGGPIINTPQVHILFVGDWSSTASQNRLTHLTQFVRDLLSSRYMNILPQYGCGASGMVASTATVSTPSNNLSSADIHNIIQAAINNGQVREPTDQATCVLLYLDDATAVNDTDVGIEMCEATGNTSFGYHYHFVTRAGNTYPFGVVPGLTDACLRNSCSSDFGCPLHLSTTQEQRQTQVTSHELADIHQSPDRFKRGLV